MIFFRINFLGFFAENEVELESLTINNVGEWFNSLHINPTFPSTVDIDISEDGFKEFDCYEIEYTTLNQLDQWSQVKYSFFF